jgi:hypothetical protein
MANSSRCNKNNKFKAQTLYTISEWFEKWDGIIVCNIIDSSMLTSSWDYANKLPLSDFELSPAFQESSIALRNKPNLPVKHVQELLVCFLAHPV